jgi:hypothetical protein
VIFASFVLKIPEHHPTAAPTAHPPLVPISGSPPEHHPFVIFAPFSAAGG